MKIHFQQKGGITGQLKSASIDTNNLSGNELQKLHSLVEDSKIFDLPSTTSPPPSGAADYFKYTIALETDDGKKHTIETTDLTKPAELGPLITYLKKKITEKKM